jgi:hypothetical protein
MLEGMVPALLWILGADLAMADFSRSNLRGAKTFGCLGCPTAAR